MLNYVQQTPGEKRKREEDPNVQFYARKIQSRPQGAFVDVIHATWDGQWERLERLHGYIQWLFPVFENAGMNWESSPLTKEGARQIRESEVMSRRVLSSYRLMLRFFGLRLVDERTGAVGRDPADADGARIGNFNSSSHNFLRISRILTSLGELGFRRYKAPFLAALRAEVAAGRLGRARSSLDRFWAPLVEGEDEEWYARKTLEEPADRGEGRLFASGGPLAADGPPTAEGDAADPDADSDADAGPGADTAQPAASDEAQPPADEAEAEAEPEAEAEADAAEAGGGTAAEAAACPVEVAGLE